ncbi:hypothetical protein [Paenibacillus polymyxa]|uniref:hypothetical protein n=1 Tax=Paenibacillus polymyxa TaxID=1406 RepID=UPI003AF359AB
MTQIFPKSSLRDKYSEIDEFYLIYIMKNPRCYAGFLRHLHKTRISFSLIKLLFSLYLIRILYIVSQYIYIYLIVSIGLSHRHIGRGIATEATAKAIASFHSEKKHEFIHAFCNPASNVICRKLGFFLLVNVILNTLLVLPYDVMTGG